jgi:DUF1680 family protein
MSTTMKSKKYEKRYLFLSGLALFLFGCGGQPGMEVSKNEAAGEFTHRMAMAENRLVGSKFKPVFTPEFILADVNIDPENPRRFYNYSGDLSGRYIEALSVLCSPGKCNHLDGIVTQALKYQHPDGRFGSPDLVFTEKNIGKEHMPLLWGNGRLLTGLLEYYKHSGSEQVLQTACRLGDFFLSTYKEVTPEVSKRLEGRGADGIICFTQYVEPLVMLSEATGNPEYAQAASKVYPTLPARTTLHTHGYLTTLRGVLQLYEYDKNRQHFDYVAKAYADLIASDDYTVYGSVKEYFGAGGDRDEGCSTADFVRLSLHLYKITHNIDYLERAEFAIYNALYYNQFFTGDFGSHIVNRSSSKSGTMSAAWWCCTMAGLRAMQIIRNDYFAEAGNDGVKLNLYLDADYSGGLLTFSMKKGKMQGDFHTYDIRFEKVTDPKLSFSVRNPSWAEDVEIFLNGKKIECRSTDNYFVVENGLTANDLLQVRVKYLAKIVTAGNNAVKLSDVAQPVFGALCYGPYVMGVDTRSDIIFSSEPDNNTVFVGTIANGAGNEALAGITTGSFVGDAYLTANYKHGGFPSYYQTVFRPVSELTFLRHPYMTVSTTFAPEPAGQSKHADGNVLVPWKEL